MKSSRSRMRHRLYIQRDVAVNDYYGHRGLPEWEALSTATGHVWVLKEELRHGADPGRESTQASARYRGIIPINTDVRETDRLEKVEDRVGQELFGMMIIDAVIRRKDHLEIRMRGHS